MDDLGLAFRDIGINMTDIEEYIQYVSPVVPAIEVPKYPVKKESHLNFLKPGSKEVLTRPVHIHEHLPPVNPPEEGFCNLFFNLGSFTQVFNFQMNLL